jgi:glycine cleavage system aminomethyltransferase T
VGSPVSLPVVGLPVVGVPVGALVSPSSDGDRVVGLPVGLPVVLPVADGAPVVAVGAAEVGRVVSTLLGPSEGDSLGARVVTVVEVPVIT